MELRFQEESAEMTQELIDHPYVLQSGVRSAKRYLSRKKFHLMYGFGSVNFPHICEEMVSEVIQKYPFPYET